MTKNEEKKYYIYILLKKKKKLIDFFSNFEIIGFNYCINYWFISFFS